jgi:hypothetical protein
MDEQERPSGFFDKEAGGQAEFEVVVSGDGADGGADGADGPQDAGFAEVAEVPDFVGLAQVGANMVRHLAVGVGNDGDAPWGWFHDRVIIVRKQGNGECDFGGLACLPRKAAGKVPGELA